MTHNCSVAKFQANLALEVCITTSSSTVASMTTSVASKTTTSAIIGSGYSIKIASPIRIASIAKSASINRLCVIEMLDLRTKAVWRIVTGSILSNVNRRRFE